MSWIFKYGVSAFSVDRIWNLELFETNMGTEWTI